MPELRLIPLDEVLGPAEQKKLSRQLEELGIGDLPSGDDVIDIEDSLADETLADFMDRLEAHEIACDIYLPVEFEGHIQVGDVSFGSSYLLADALEELRDELNIDAEEDEEEEEEGVELEMIEEQLSFIWHVFARAASASISRQVPLHVIS